MPPRKNTPMCAVRIGYQTVLMPAAAGMKVVSLLADAVKCTELFDPDMDYCYEVEEQLSVRYQSVRPAQIYIPAPKRPRALEYQGD